MSAVLLMTLISNPRRDLAVIVASMAYNTWFTKLYCKDLRIVSVHLYVPVGLDMDSSHMTESLANLQLFQNVLEMWARFRVKFQGHISIGVIAELKNAVFYRIACFFETVVILFVCNKSSLCWIALHI